MDKKINQPQGPRNGNHGNPQKVAQFHEKHSRAEMLAGSVVKHFSGESAKFSGNMERQEPVSLSKTTGKKK